MAQIRFSIIIPTYNSQKEVQRAILSVQNQSFKNLEIIVVDDYSTDNTYETLSKYNNIQLLRNSENLKAGGARNKGLDIAKGEYIIFLDADDYLADKDTLSKIDKTIGKNKYDVIYMGFEMSGRSGKKYIPTKEEVEVSKRIRKWKYENVWDICWNNNFLKENQMRFVEKRYFEDFVFYYKGIMRAKSFCIADFVTHIYTDTNSNSITSKISEQKLQDLNCNISILWDELKVVEEERKSDMIFILTKMTEYLLNLLKDYRKKVGGD